MTTQELETEGAGTGAGAGTPTPAASTPALGASDIEAIVAALEPKIMGRLSQSAKDRTLAELKPQMDDFRGKLADLERLTSAGLSRDAALEIMELKANLPGNGKQTAQTAVPTTSAGNRSTEPNAFDPSGTLTALNLDANDPEFIALQRAGNVDAAAVLAYAVRKLSKPAPPAAQTMPSGAGAPPPAEDDLDDLTTKLQALMVEPGKNMAEIRILQEKQRKLLSGR